MSFDDALQTAANSIPECVAAGYVDVASGMLLSITTVASHPRQVIDMLAAATGDLFNGESVTMIERMFKKSAWPARRLPLFSGSHRQQREPAARVFARQN